MNRFLRSNNERTTTEQPKIFKTISYVPNIAERMNKINFYDKNTVRVAYKIDNTLRRIFSNTKSKINKLDKNNVIYSIKCNGNAQDTCQKIYVGTTKKCLKTRLSGHKSNLRTRNTDNCQRTALSAHCAEHNHSPDFDNVRVLQTEKAYNKRLTIEMLHIINTSPDKRINYKVDTENIAHTYRHLVYKAKNIKTKISRYQQADEMDVGGGVS